MSRSVGSTILAARLLLAFAFGAALTSTGCAAHAPQAKSAATTVNASPIAVVSDETFAQTTYKVLLSGEASANRTSLLVGAVRRQLQRAKARFDAGQREAGLKALTGAFYLMRAGEFQDAALDGAEGALGAGAAEVARLGQEGYAFTLYGMLKDKLPKGPERQEVEAHLEAMARFSQATHGAGPMQAAGADLRSATQRSLFEARKSALDAASERAVQWLKRALESNAADAPMNSNADRDEAFEAYRAQRGGGYTLIALYLRHGDARGVLTAADHADVSRIIAPELRDRLERAADENDADAWADLCHFFDSASHAADAEGLLDHTLMEAATWGAAVQLFRAEPNSMRGAAPLAAQTRQLRDGRGGAFGARSGRDQGSEPREPQLRAQHRRQGAGGGGCARSIAERAAHLRQRAGHAGVGRN
ncbi:MAG: hypothetical protein WDO74_34575 [Pseudomonadota bacterium]